LKRPSLASILYGLIPFAAICLPVSLWDRVNPRIFGLPFNFFWLISWLVLTPVCMWGSYRAETGRAANSHQDNKGLVP
jgi:hypothetical protein